MLNELKFNLKLMLKKKELIFAILIALILNIVHVILVISDIKNQQMFLSNYYSAEYSFILYNPLVTFSSLIIIIFPLILTLVFSDIGWREKKDNTITFLHTRINIKRNVLVRIFTIFLVSFTISFVSFFLNYLMLSIILKNGTIITFFQELPFDLNYYPEYFLDKLRYNDPFIFCISINLIISGLIGLLCVFSYSISFWVRQKLVIYFSPLIYMIFSELIFPTIGFKSLSIVRLLQPFARFSLNDVVISSIFILILSFLLLFIKVQKKDYVL